MTQGNCMATESLNAAPYRPSLCLLAAIVLLLLSAPLPLASQNVPPTSGMESGRRQEDGRSYFLQQVGEEDESPTIFQILEWSPGRHVKWYEVQLEMQDGDGWVPVDNAIPETGQAAQDAPEFLGDGRYKTTANRLVVSLRAKDSGEPQTYRYTVSSYNLLGHRAFSTDYTEFQIKKGYIPRVEGISPDLIYLDTLYDPTIRVSGNDLRKETQYYLTNGREIIRPVEIIPNDNNRRAEVVFNPRDFDVGEWVLRAENPGEFTSDLPLTIKFMKWYDVSLSAGYSPLVVLADENVKGFLGTNFMPLGIDARATFIFLKRRMGYLGVSLNGKWNTVLEDFSAHSITTHYVQGLASFVYRYPIIRNRLTVEARVGGGMTLAAGLKIIYPHDLESEAFSSIFPAATIGLSIAGYVWRGMFVEAGADLTSTFTPGMLILSISPTISFGWTL